jgi:acetylornithine deacetylase/succinyl-diaminopimelate desuccinylase-like protein
MVTRFSCIPLKDNTRIRMVMIELLSELIRNRCVNPPGGEMRSINSIRRYLRRRGVDSMVYESAPGRGNLVARIPSTGGGPGLMFGPGHVDVAPVEKPDAWEVDPFQAVIRDGYMWGRGSHDMLFMVTAHVQAFADLHGSGFTPRGDLTLLVVCDEEDEGAYGTGWMLENHPEMVRTDYAVSEAGGWPREPGEVVFTYGESGGGCSPVESGFVAAMERAVRTEMPDAALVPETMPGKTDFKFLRPLGVECYGFGLYDPDTPQDARMVHGPNERVSLKTLELTRRVCFHLARDFLK